MGQDAGPGSAAGLSRTSALTTSLTPSLNLPATLRALRTADAAFTRSPAFTLKPAVQDVVPLVRLPDLRYIRPDQAQIVSEINWPRPGIPRAQVSVPLAQNDTPSDTELFTDPKSPAQQYYLPRHALQQTVPDISVQLRRAGSGWALTIRLLSLPAPELGDGARNATELPHQVAVLLSYLVGGAGGTRREWVLDATRAEGHLVATMVLPDLSERNQLYTALTDPQAAAQLTVRRSFRAAVPVEGNPPVPIGPRHRPPVFLNPDRPVFLNPARREPAEQPPGRRVTLSAHSSDLLLKGQLQRDIGRSPALDDQQSATGFIGLPAVVSRNPSVCNVYVRGGDNALWQLPYDGTWHPWARHDDGAVLASEPAVNSMGPDHEQVFVRGTDNQVWQKYWSGGLGWSWSGWSPLGAPLWAGSTPVSDASSAVLHGTFSFDFESGVEAPGGDVFWEQMTETTRALVPKAGAQLAWIGAGDFDALSADALRAEAFSAGSINGSNDTGNQLLPGMLFAVRTRNGQFAKVQVTAYGYDLGLRWVTYPAAPAPTEPLYRERDLTLDEVIAPLPFMFPPALNPGVWDGVTGGGAALALKRCQVGSQVYFQDVGLRRVFFYLPDGFKLARSPSAPHGPLLKVRFVPGKDDPAVLSAEMKYTALPYISPLRFQRDVKPLLELYLAAEGVSESQVLFQPLLPEASALRLLVGWPRSDGSPTFQPSTEARISLSDSLWDLQHLSLPEFQEVFDALFGQSGAVFTGQVEVKVNDGVQTQTYVVPLTASLNDLIGEPYALQVNGGTSPSVTLSNVSESPLRLDALTLGAPDCTLSLSGAVFPLTLPPAGQPGSQVVWPLAVTGTPPGPNTVIGITEVRAVPLPDPELVWNAVLDPSVTRYSQRLSVKTSRSLFAPEADPLLELDVEVRKGDGPSVSASLSASLGSPDQAVIATDLLLSFPVADLVLRRPDQGQYSYRVGAVRASGQHLSEWKIASDPVIWVLQPDLT